MTYSDAAYGSQMGQSMQQQPSQLFTPGLTGDNQFTAQQGQQQPPYFQGQDPQYINGPAFAQQQQQPPYVAQQQVGQLADQFGQMGIGGQKPVSMADDVV
jgi:protein transport protein SEC24